MALGVVGGRCPLPLGVATPSRGRRHGEATPFAATGRRSSTPHSAGCPRCAVYSGI